MNHLTTKSTNHAFTLIEILMSIAIIAILIGLLLPVLGTTRDKSRKLASAVNLRSIGQIFDLYIQSADDLYPAPTPGEFYQYAPPLNGRGTMSHWAISNRWHEFFAESYPWQEYKQVFLAPGAQRETEIQPMTAQIFPSYQYSASFLGHPTIWTQQEFSEAQWPKLERSVKRHMVKFTSAKALMWDIEMPYIRRPLQKDANHNLLESTPMLFADQHVTNHIPAEATQGIFNRATYAARLVENLHNTPNGVYGRDY